MESNTSALLAVMLELANTYEVLAVTFCVNEPSEPLKVNAIGFVSSRLVTLTYFKLEETN